MSIFHTQIALHGYTFDDYQIGVKLEAGVTTASQGLALSQDASADSTCKLADEGEAIIARLLVVENRVNEGQLIGTAAFRFADKFKVKAGLAGAEVVARGKFVCGAGNGEIRALDPTDADDAKLIPSAPRVWAVAGGFATCTNF